MDAAFCANRIEQHYGRHRILQDCSIAAAEGECIGIAGRNGSGKSTFLQVLAGVRRPTGGELTYLGENLLKPGKRISSVVAYVPQNNPLIEELTAGENLRLLGGHRAGRGEAVIRKLRVDDFLNRKVRDLSGGMKRRLALACALIEMRPVLIMDEPTSALDLCQKQIILDYLSYYREQKGIVVMATHDIEEMHFSDRLYLISGGSARECLPEEAVNKIKGV